MVVATFNYPVPVREVAALLQSRRSVTAVPTERVILGVSGLIAAAA
jgi:hypothetical protein